MTERIKKSLALLISVVMLTGLISFPALANEPEQSPDAGVQTQLPASQVPDAGEVENLKEENKIVDNQLLVTTKDNSAVEDKVEDTPEDEVVDTVHSDDYSTVVVETTDDLADKMEEYNNDPNVEAVQPNFIYTLMDDTDYDLQATTNDPGASSQWYLNSNMKVNNAWNFVRTGKSVKVAVIDSGIQGDHPDLSANINKKDSYDFVNNTTAVTDSYGHGTHVAGIIAGAANNGTGIAGVSYNAELLSYRVFWTDPQTGNQTTTSQMALKGYNKAVADGARVINLSFGGYASTGFNDTSLEAAINGAKAKGIVTVCAGGNGLNGSPQTQMIYPGDYDACISVVATNSSEGRDGRFDYNQYKDIAAPGINIYSTYNGSGYAISNGTSMAAPMVSGIVAMMLTAEPNLSVDQIKNIMYSTAKDLGTAGRDDYYGNGLINAEKCVRGAYSTIGALNSYTNAGDKVLPDIDYNVWYTKAVRYVTTRGVMTGINNDTIFDPAGYMVRAHVTETTYKKEGKPSVTYSGIFPDVKNGLWYTNSIMWNNSKGIVTGYTNTGLFGPVDKVNREQLVTMLFRYAKVKGVDTSARGSLAGFGDAGKVNAFASDAMQWAVAKGIITGDGGKINPQENANRAHCAQMMMRFLEAYQL